MIPPFINEDAVEIYVDGSTKKLDKFRDPPNSKMTDFSHFSIFEMRESGVSLLQIWSSTERKIGLLSDAMSTWLFDDFLLFDFSK